jgi:hypothetical protein
MNKVCCECKRDDVEFGNRKNGSLQSRCRSCQRDYAKNHYNSHKKYYIEKVRRHSGNCLNSLRKKILTYLSDKKCVDCDEKDPVVLEFDHKEPGKKKYSVSEISRRSWKRTLAEISKCEIRCANCHRRKTAKQFGWYRSVLCNNGGVG